MIYFICWVVFLVVLILGVGVAHLMDIRGNRASRSSAAANEPSFDEDVAVEQGEEPWDEAAAVESFEEFPADGKQPVDDFAAFEEEFK